MSLGASYQFLKSEVRVHNALGGKIPPQNSISDFEEL